MRTRMVGGKWKLYFDLDVDFQNNTRYDFDVDTAGYILMRKINVFHKGVLLGVATSNTTRIYLPAYGNFRVTDIQVEVSLIDAINDLSNNGLDTAPGNYSLEIFVEALHSTFVVEQPLSQFV
jgi:hypothetical protein